MRGRGEGGWIITHASHFCTLVRGAILGMMTVTGIPGRQGARGAQRGCSGPGRVSARRLWRLEGYNTYSDCVRAVSGVV